VTERLTCSAEALARLYARRNQWAWRDAAGRLVPRDKGADRACAAHGESRCPTCPDAYWSPAGLDAGG